jgi:hypothetical protein
VVCRVLRSISRCEFKYPTLKGELDVLMKVMKVERDVCGAAAQGDFLLRDSRHWSGRQEPMTLRIMSR